MWRKKRNLLSLVLAISVMFSCSFHTLASELDAPEKTDFEFINTDDFSNVEYIYKENGKKYKVIEHANENLTVVETFIYEVCNDNEMVLSDKIVTHVSAEDNKIIVLTTKANKEIAKEVILIANEQKSISETNSVSRAKTGWVHVYNSSGSTKFANYSLTVVIAVLAAAVGYLSKGLAGAIAAEGISSVAKIIIDEQIPVGYMRQTMHYYYPDTSGVPTKYRAITNFFRKSNYSGFIGLSREEGNIILGGN